VQKKQNSANKPQVVSLFCGPGGFDEGFRQAGYDICLAYDVDPAAIQTHRLNHPKTKAICADLSRIDVNSIIDEWKRRTDLNPTGIIGGSPCQAFSRSNVYQRARDPRHWLTSRYAQILEALNKEFGIAFFVFENVPGLAGSKHKLKLSRLLHRFERMGFRITQAMLDARFFGIAQMRPRLFVVGVNIEIYPNSTLELPVGDSSRKRTVADAIGELPEPVFFRRGLKPSDIPTHPNHWCMNPMSPRFKNGNLLAGHAQGRSFRVLQWDRPSYTVAYGNREVHVHPLKHRRLSVYEAMLLQGFSEGYVLCGSLSDQVRLVSGAVPPPLARAVGVAIREQLLLPNFDEHKLIST
jgi:DNA (cytosine-5)-methyltransferase 1